MKMQEPLETQQTLPLSQQMLPLFDEAAARATAITNEADARTAGEQTLPLSQQMLPLFQMKVMQELLVTQQTLPLSQQTPPLFQMKLPQRATITNEAE
jgi:hypothetical protein